MCFGRFGLMAMVVGLVMAGGLLARAGERIAIALDPGSNSRESRQMAMRMERDLDNILERRGKYSTRILKSKDEFKKGAGEYLLDVRMTRYNAGSKAARIIVGFGAGSAALDIHYELTGPHGNTLLSRDDGCATSLDWQRLARKLNENILTAIQARFRAGNLDAEEGVTPAGRAAKVPAAEVLAPVAVPVIAPPAREPVAITVPDPAVAAPAGDPVEQLRQLDTMKRKKLISESEYKQKRKQILDRL